MRIDLDAFEEWKAHPVTEELMKCCVRWAEEAKAHWVNSSWNGGEANPEFLARMRARANAFEQLHNLTFEQMKDTLE